MTIEALRAAEALYRLLNMQLSNVVRGETHIFLELRIQRATRKLNDAKSALNAHLRNHGAMSCPAFLGDQQAFDCLRPTGCPEVDADEELTEDRKANRPSRIKSRIKKPCRTDDFDD